MSTQSKQATHTPTPWHKGDGLRDNIVYDENGYAVCDCKTYHGKGLAKAYENSQFIVRAVNSYEVMLQALKDVDKFHQDNFEIMPVAFQTFANIIEEAINKAEGE